MGKFTLLRRRWFHFSLRTLLTLFALLAIPLSWIAKERSQSRRELQIADQLQMQGVRHVILGGHYDSEELLASGQPQGWWRNLARLVLGERVLIVSGAPADFHDLTPLARLHDLQDAELLSTAVSDLTPLANLKQLRQLNLNCTQVHDLTPLAGLTNLQGLGISETQVSDLTPLVGLKRLTGLYMPDAQVSDLTPLAGLKELTSVNVFGRNVNLAQVEALQAALPNCKIANAYYVK